MSPEAKVPLHKSVQTLLNHNTHPGLALDKYALSYGIEEKKWQEKVQKSVCDKVSLMGPAIPDTDFKALWERRKRCLNESPTLAFSAKTAGPFTLHLSRASALENAGICLHPLYGFVYLPGTGLKGMARAYAETVWKPSQKDQEKASHIISVLGNEPEAEKQCSGHVVFHDAWPCKWPKLIVDIVNCHHGEYYGAKPEDNTNAPGDWGNPIPVYFLAVPEGETFSFALSKTRADVPDEDLNLAKEWLAGALEHAGAGAKTAAGYGTFKLIDEEDTAEHVGQTWKGALQKEVRAEYSADLELVSPAFLAGANQKEEDCDLRPATLRGLLRWWWRTMHAKHVSVADLRKMEAAVWGDTKSGGAVRIEIRHAEHSPPLCEDVPGKFIGKNKKRQDTLLPDDNALRRMGIKPNHTKTTQPLFYASYGMDEMRTGDRESRRQRKVVQPGAKWRLRIIARKGSYENTPLGAQQLHDQAVSALWLLCRFGGVGAKSRKGFGSFADINDWSLDKCKKASESFRKACQVEECRQAEPESPALEIMLEHTQKTLWTNPWFALDQIGDAMQTFAQSPKNSGHGKHCDAKIALGLPRQIHGPLKFKMVHQTSYTPPRQLSGPKGDRHTSPVHYHLAKDADGKLIVRVVAFPAKYLPDFKTSKAFLEKLMDHLKADLARRAQLPDAKPQPRGSRGAREGGSERRPGRPESPTRQTPSGIPSNWSETAAILLEAKTSKGKWRAKCSASGNVGHIDNSDDIPPAQKPGDNVTLIVLRTNADGSMVFLWPTDDTRKQAEEARRNIARKNQRRR